VMTNVNPDLGRWGKYAPRPLSSAFTFDMDQCGPGGLDCHDKAPIPAHLAFQGSFTNNQGKLADFQNFILKTAIDAVP
jgi:hypothetical protein